MLEKTLAHYEILEKIGAGGMGEVYRARDTKLARDVAIKSLPPAFASDSDHLARFEREARLLAGLNHPNIGSIYGIEEAKDSRYLILELVEGEDLAQRIARGPISVSDALPMALQIAEALEAAHEQGVVHRDLKPGNIKLTPEGKIKILDFGLAKALDQDSDAAAPLHDSPTMPVTTHTASGIILGTAAYMSPEQARGTRVDKRADMFAFGAVLLEMLTGQQAFPGSTVSDILAAVLRAEPPYQHLPADTPAPIRRLLERCLEKDVNRRLRDIGEARIVLEDVLSGETGAEAPKEGTPPGFLQVYGGWIAALLAGVAVLALLVTRSSGPAPDIPFRKSTISLDPRDASLRLDFDMQLSPDGRYLAYTSQGRLWMRDLTTVESRELPGTDEAQSPFWSRDGGWIVFGQGDRIAKVPREGGAPTPLTTLPASQRLGSGSSGAWTADGHVLITTSNAGILQVSAQGGEISTLVTPTDDETDFHEMCLLPDDRGIVFVVHGPRGYGILDLRTPDGDRRRLLDIEDNINKPGYSPSGHIVFTRTGSTPGVWAFPFSLDTLERTGEPFLVAAGADLPTVSGDGSLAYLTGLPEETGQLVWIDREGNPVGTIGTPAVTARPFPSLSPDEKSLVMALRFGESRELYLFDLASNNQRRLTFNDLREDVANWVPGKNALVFYESNSFFTYYHSLDGSEENRQLLKGIMPMFTPDGSAVIFSRTRPNSWNWDIHLRPAGGEEGDETTLVSTDGIDWYASFSPDGKYIVYASAETGRDEVYVTTFPTPTTRWQVSNNGGTWPRWGARSNEIYYTTRDQIHVVSVSTEGGLTLGTPRVLFDRPSIDWNSQWPDGFDVTADGQQFVMMRPVETEVEVEPEIVIVQNWHREFQTE